MTEQEYAYTVETQRRVGQSWKPRTETTNAEWAYQDARRFLESSVASRPHAVRVLRHGPTGRHKAIVIWEWKP